MKPKPNIEATVEGVVLRNLIIHGEVSIIPLPGEGYVIDCSRAELLYISGEDKIRQIGPIIGNKNLT
jgi:hypothetical protein